MFWMCRHNARCVLVQVDGFRVNPDDDKANEKRKVFPTTDKGRKCKRMMQRRKQMGNQCTQVKDILGNSIQRLYSLQEYPGLPKLGKYQKHVSKGTTCPGNMTGYK